MTRSWHCWQLPPRAAVTQPCLPPPVPPPQHQACCKKRTGPLLPGFVGSSRGVQPAAHNRACHTPGTRPPHSPSPATAPRRCRCRPVPPAEATPLSPPPPRRGQSAGAPRGGGGSFPGAALPLPRRGRHGAAALAAARRGARPRPRRRCRRRRRGGALAPGARGAGRRGGADGGAAGRGAARRPARAGARVPPPARRLRGGQRGADGLPEPPRPAGAALPGLPPPLPRPPGAVRQHRPRRRGAFEGRAERAGGCRVRGAACGPSRTGAGVGLPGSSRGACGCGSSVLERKQVPGGGRRLPPRVCCFTLPCGGTVGVSPGSAPWAYAEGGKRRRVLGQA